MPIPAPVKKIARWLLPMGIYDLIQTTRNRDSSHNSAIAEIDPALKASLEGNSAFRYRHQGQRCFVLATGPSIREQDLTCLAGETCIAVSHFFLHKDIDVIRPRYHVLAPYHPPFTFDAIRKVFDGFIERYSGYDIDYFFGFSPYQYSIYAFLKQFPEYQFPNAHFINYMGSAQLDESNVHNPDMWDMTKTPFAVRTVVYSAIQLAVYMGFVEIYLLGCDHDYLSDIQRVTNHHFYKEEDGVSDVEHLKTFTTERWFEEYYYRWKQYRLMREYLESKGVEIYNATKGGMLDVFTRVNLSDILSES